jgi:hypothetical protein
MAEYEIVKTDDEQRLVFGWASVAALADGALLEDHQGDVIEPAELERAAYDFAEHHRAINEMHAGADVGALVESFVVTPDKLAAMGFPPEVAKGMGVRHWIGARVSPEVFAKVKAGQLRMFSIEGTALREEVAA